MAITNEQATNFSDHYLRPMAEMLRWLQSSGNEMVDQWNAFGGATLFPNDAGEIIQDQNAATRPFSGADANVIITRVQGVVAVLNAAFAMDGVLPATVRSLGPSSGPGHSQD